MRCVTGLAKFAATPDVFRGDAASATRRCLINVDVATEPIIDELRLRRLPEMAELKGAKVAGMIDDTTDGKEYFNEVRSAQHKWLVSFEKAAGDVIKSGPIGIQDATSPPHGLAFEIQIAHLKLLSNLHLDRPRLGMTLFPLQIPPVL